jgi:hypothetical protein
VRLQSASRLASSLSQASESADGLVVGGDPLDSWLRLWPAKTNEGSAVGSAVGVAVGSSVPVLNVSGVLLPLDFLDL